ncbi:MAG: hypothetical protein ACK5NB_07345 [Flavobacteriaceae bacterium]
MRKAVLLLTIVLSTTFMSFKTEAKKPFLKKGYTVAFSETYFKEMISATSTNDKTYFKKLITDKKIMVLPSDIPVDVISSSAIKGTVVARIKGKENKLWTIYEALHYK